MWNKKNFKNPKFQCIQKIKCSIFWDKIPKLMKMSIHKFCENNLKAVKICLKYAEIENFLWFLNNTQKNICNKEVKRRISFGKKNSKSWWRQN